MHSNVFAQRFCDNRAMCRIVAKAVKYLFMAWLVVTGIRLAIFGLTGPRQYLAVDSNGNVTLVQAFV